MDSDRARLLLEHMIREGIEVLVCRMPQNVVMLTGYLPVLGNTFCVLTKDRPDHLEVRLALPEDEVDLVPPDVAVEVRTYAEETLTMISDTLSAAREPMRELFTSAGVSGTSTIGYEGGKEPIVTAYTQIGAPGPNMLALFSDLLPVAKQKDATGILEEVAAIKTEAEVAWIRRCVGVAREGFEAARAAIQIGATEAAVSAAASSTMLLTGFAVPGAHRVLPYVHVMSGPRAADAYKAYNLTSNRTLEHGDTVNVQLEVNLNGYWAELTRTFFVGEASETWRMVHNACVAAQHAALRVIRDGTNGRDADSTARQVMDRAGFGEEFKHGLGHGLGFQAINHSAQPILHPVSTSVLRTNMVHNVEPAVYLQGEGGFRLNDDVLVKQHGNEVLSHAIPRDLDWLIVRA